MLNKSSEPPMRRGEKQGLRWRIIEGWVGRPHFREHADKACSGS